MVVSCGAALGSRSHRSWCTSWKCHRRLPLRASSATMDAPKRFGAVAIRSIEVIRRRSERQEDDAAANVDRRLTPVIRRRRCISRHLSATCRNRTRRARHGVERPDEFSGEDVVGPDIARRRHIVFARRAPEDDQILENSSGRVRLNRSDPFRIAAVDPDAQVDDPIGAERHDRLSRLRVHLLQQAVHREDEPLVAPVLAFPVVDAAARHAGHVLADPQLLAASPRRRRRANRSARGRRPCRGRQSGCCRCRRTDTSTPPADE